jgi:trimeric autotransporter adhesin
LALPGNVLAQTLDAAVWAADNTVTTIARTDSAIYIGGSFKWVGPCTGGFVGLDPSTAKPQSQYPKMDGGVQVAVPDGSGGWFLAGGFRAVRGLPRANLAHILADGSVANWNPAANAPVWCAALAESTLYVGGFFTSVGGASRQYLAAISTQTGLATPWDPSPNGLVASLLCVGTRLYVGGSGFTAIAGEARSNLAAFDLAADSLLDWNPSAGGPIYTLTEQDGRILAGGSFTAMGGQPRSCLAAIDGQSGEVLSWNPHAVTTRGMPEVRSVAVDGESAYIGGYFDSLGFAPRASVGAVSLASGAATPWDVRMGGVAPYVGAVAVHRGHAYIGGLFTTVGGETRNNIVEADLNTGTVQAWDPIVRGFVAWIAATDRAVLAGGSFKIVGGQPRNCLAALDAKTGALKSWAPEPDGLIVYAIAAEGDLVYVGGHFSAIGGQPRSCIAAVDATTGAATDWNPSANDLVRCLAVRGGTMIVGGQFTSVGGASRPYLAEIGMNGLATDWAPNPDDWVWSLTRAGSSLYAGGWFARIGGAQRSCVAAIDTNGAVTAFDAKLDAQAVVTALAASDSALYIGGAITSAAGEARTDLVAADLSTGRLLRWDPRIAGALQRPEPVIYALATGPGVVYFGGDFYSVGGDTRPALAAVDAESGRALAWSAGVDGSVWSLCHSNGRLYAGGIFNSLAGMPCSYFGSLAALDSTTTPVPPGQPKQALMLAQNAPNPSRGGTTIAFTLASAGLVALEVFDLQGRRVAWVMHNEPRLAGRYSVELQTRGLVSGCYIYRLSASGETASRKMLVLN